MAHYLDSLLRPGSIAVLGATERAGSVGRQTMVNLQRGQYSGRLYAVNPRYESVLGVNCYPSLAEVPETVEHVIFAVGDARVEAALNDVIAHGARAATIMSTLILEQDREPGLRQRVAARIAESGLRVCGANGMGFYNFRDGVWACGFDTRAHRNDGTVAYISQSGSGMAGIVDVDERIDFNLAVSSGQELSVGLHDYLDFALDLPETKVVGLFMETIRDPEAMISALRKASERDIPVVALKVGRTEFAAQMALSHTGAIAGRDAAYHALFDRYGVQRVGDMDELATALIMFAQPHPVADGGLVSIHDSGGERQLLIDLADEWGVPLAEISASSVSRLEALLDPGLPPVNPLDAWGAGGPDADRVMTDCFSALMQDADAALGAVVHDRAPGGEIYPEYLDYLRRAHRASGKPVFLVSNRQGTGADPAVAKMTREGFPVLDGVHPFLTGVRCLFAYRNFRARDVGDLPAQPLPENIDRWCARLATGESLGELESAQLAADFSISVNPIIPADDEKSVVEAAAAAGFPVVLKTAKPGVSHKTDVGGVRLNLGNELELTKAYREMCEQLGPAVVVSPMITGPGVEMLLGLVRDPQFGPLMVLGFGGTNVETIGDFAYALPPFGVETARRLVDSLRMRPLLDGRRGSAPVALDKYCEEAAKFSRLAAALADVVEEVDLNPVIVQADRCVAVDALVVGHARDSVRQQARQTG